MQDEANIVKQYEEANVSGRIEILIKYYPNFIRLVEGYEQSLSFIIKEEKAYKHRQAKGELGVRVQTSGMSDPTAREATLALKQMIGEAKKMENEFTLSDLQTFADVGDVIAEYKMKETPASVRARLGKMFNEAVRNGAVPGINRAVVEKNGEEQLKFYCRAAVYVNYINKLKKGAKKK